MAFQMSILACRFKIPSSIGALTHCRGISCIKEFGPKSNPNLNSNVSAANLAPKSVWNPSVRKPTCSVFTRRFYYPTLHSGVADSGTSAAKFSTNSSATRSFQAGSVGKSSRRKNWSVAKGCFVLVSALGLTTVVASLHSSPLCAMATGSDSINLDSSNTDWKEAKKFMLTASQQERQALYWTADFLSLDQVPIWTPSGQPTGDQSHPANEVLNPKISLFRGDITKLEVDAIVNAGKNDYHIVQSYW
ncbi:hypothetical protein JZ751_006824, partial [Albula glossodonta]